MAYPGENEHKEYLDYAIAEQEEGRSPMSKDEWRKKRKGSEPVASRREGEGFRKTILSDGG